MTAAPLRAFYLMKTRAGFDRDLAVLRAQQWHLGDQLFSLGIELGAKPALTQLALEVGIQLTAACMAIAVARREIKARRPRGRGDIALNLRLPFPSRELRRGHEPRLP